MKKTGFSGIRKIRSKKGMSLVEVLVGVAIIVIVFASTLGAMVGGYTTTVYNADENRTDLLNSSVNEIVFNTFSKMKISDVSQAEDVIDQIVNSNPTSNDLGTAVAAAISEKVPGAVFVSPQKISSGKYEPVFNNGVSFQYTLVPDVGVNIGKKDDTRKELYVEGIRIVTCFESAKGSIINESFVPYS